MVVCNSNMTKGKKVEGVEGEGRRGCKFAC